MIGPVKKEKERDILKIELVLAFVCCIHSGSAGVCKSIIISFDVGIQYSSEDIHPEIPDVLLYSEPFDLNIQF